MTSKDLQWLASIESFIAPRHLACLKLVVGQQIGRYFDLEPVKSVLGVHDLLKADEKWPPNKSLQLIIDFLTLCRLQPCVKRLGKYGLDDLPSLDLEVLNDGARYARLVAGVYCPLSGKERIAFQAKYCELSHRGDQESVEKFLMSVVHNGFDKDLLQKAVEGIQLTTKSGSIVEQVFLEENIQIELNLLRVQSNLGICRWIVVLVSLLLVFSLFVVLLALPIRLPTGYTATHTAQSGVVVVAARVDPFWYGAVEVDVPPESEYKATAPLSCTNLVSQVHSLNKTSASIPVSRRSYHPLQLLEDHSYLVENSTLNITITIVDQPALAPVLYQLNNWTQYGSLLPSDDPPSTDQHVKSYPINRTGNTTVSITVTSNDFYFFLLYLPALTVFQYQFSLNRYYYRPADYKFEHCTSTTSCRFPLTPSYTSGSDIQCQLLQVSGAENDFISVNTNIRRNPVVLPIFVPAIIMSLILILFLLAYIVVAIYCALKNCKNGMKETGIV